MKKIWAFTLAEVLITLAIIGVVAALTIPSVIANTQQQEFKTGLKKAVSVLNSSITMNLAIDGESPYDNANLFEYLQRHMAVMKSTTDLTTLFRSVSRVDYDENGTLVRNHAFVNSVFYTTDGMRFEFINGQSSDLKRFPLHEGEGLYACPHSTTSRNFGFPDGHCMGCGSLGLASNTDNTSKPPCVITVDVNGDRKPTPQNMNCTKENCEWENKYWISDPKGKRLYDVFSIMITDKQAIPYGVAAQKAMYEAQK